MEFLFDKKDTQGVKIIPRLTEEFMHTYLVRFIVILLLLTGCQKESTQAFIRINQQGYRPDDIKVAVLGSMGNTPIEAFAVFSSTNHLEVYRSDSISSKGAYGPFRASFRLNFTEFKESGLFYIKAGDTRSPDFRIGEGVYDDTADFLLKYMRQQRCGYNPFLADSCHLDDGYIIYHPTRTGERIDVTGGWHDATDYLQYTATSANAVFQLLFAYRENPGAFGDSHQANGMPGANGIPDVIDEAKFGMDWLKKMNPTAGEYYNQIADDRDHAGFRLPNQDSVIYDPDHKGRPVYLASPEPQGLKKYKNRSTGVANTAGKFASAFAMGASVLKDFYPEEYTADLPERALAAYNYGKANPGVSQTAPCKGPYFYEEENWIDDMELAAASLYKITGEGRFREEGLDYASREMVSPWMGQDSVRHYQYYPFINAGHHELGTSPNNNTRDTLASYYAKGLELLYQRGKDDPFFIGIPFVWCSNNFVTAALTQCRLYRELSGDTRYSEMEAALRDWLFGCNPWGSSMIVGLPRIGDAPEAPHSSLTILEGYPTNGGLVDGPVYGSIYNSLIGLQLYEPDEYADFQSDLVVYHDDAGDYSTNEPTMDGTASLVYYLSSLEQSGKVRNQPIYDETGAIRRGDTDKKRLHLTFTGDTYADGGDHILATLEKYDIKASFFLTGNFYRNPEFSSFIRKAIEQGHYLGAHSDRHLLYNDWSPDKALLVTREEFRADLEANYREMEKFGIQKQDASYFLPPYEWNDSMITQWADQMNMTLVNYTPGTLTHADYTTPGMKNYRSSEAILTSVREEEQQEGLNGFILLSHLGTHPDRTDKFYLKLEDLIIELQTKGYELAPLEQLLTPYR